MFVDRQWAKPNVVYGLISHARIIAQNLEKLGFGGLCGNVLQGAVGGTFYIVAVF